MRRFFATIDNISSGGISLGADETRHLGSVLRLRAGEQVTVFDGEGREFLCRVEQINKNNVQLMIIDETVPTAPESGLDLTLAAAVLKGEKFDLVIQKSVELGVTTLVPLQTVRCDVRLKGFEKRVERWRKIILESSKQSGRAKLMQIAEPVELKRFVTNAVHKDLVLFSERNGKPFEPIKSRKKITALVGPEGGWDDSELQFAKSQGVRIVTLGGRVLRAESAAIAIAAILQHRFGDFK